MITYFLRCVFLIIALSPGVLLQENVDLKYELYNIDSLKDCKCNFTLDLVPICNDKNVMYDRKQMFECIEKCSKISIVNVIHNRGCSQKLADKLSIEECKKQCIISLEYDPVCGSDGVTYPNPSYLQCVAKCEKPGLSYNQCGYCLPQDKEKPKDNMDNQKEYLSKKEAKEFLDLSGPCECVTTYELNPVCGSDGISYPNPSVLYCAKKCNDTDLEIQSCGRCPEKDFRKIADLKKPSIPDNPILKCLQSCVVSLELFPICGTDNKTYDNLSILKCYNLCTNKTIEVQYEGSCNDVCLCPMNKDYNPVCGNDKVTYANPSTLFCAEKCGKSDLKLLYCGDCKVKQSMMAEQRQAVIPDSLSKVFDKCGCVVTLEYAPVCGTDGMVYDNPSIFYCTRKCVKPDISIRNCGYCDIKKESSLKSVQQNDKDFKSLSDSFLKCDCVATSVLLPVCGNDGVTYPHPAYIYCVQKCNGNENLQLAYCGPCDQGKMDLPKADESEEILSQESLEIFEKCRCVATKEKNPVCGSNNITYSNPSVFSCSKKCIDPDIQISYCGPCKKRSMSKPLSIDNFKSDDYDDRNVCPCIAPREYKPVCGSDGHNYANPVVLECARNCTKQNISIAYDGLCNNEKKELFFSQNRKIRSAQFGKFSREIDNLLGCNCLVKTSYEPVCGTDGKTYPNLSQLSCNNLCYRRYVYVDHYGPCYQPSSTAKPCKCIGTEEYAPVCGSDGETYPNYQQLNCINSCENKNINKIHDGPCNEADKKSDKPSESSCECNIDASYEPLCGSDGEDYINYSQLVCFNNCNNTRIYKAHDGFCQYPTKPTDPPISKRCKCVFTYDARPTCASDGKTYGNRSEMDCANSCYRANIVAVHYGPCAA